MKIKAIYIIFITIIAIFLVLPFTVLAAKESVGEGGKEVDEKSAPHNIQELKEAILNLIKEKNIPAVAIAMIDETGPVWVGALGKANIENNIPANENSLFRIGSTSKMFVALSVLKLVEEGKLSLMDEVSKLAPDIEFENKWSDTDPIRVVHLLEHTTGWDDIHLSEYAHSDPTPITLKQGLDFHPHSRVSRWKPGSRFSYCNSGPSVAAYIVEKITGKSFESYVQEHFFDPIGMESATFYFNDDVKKRGVTLYDTDNQPLDYWHVLMRPTGAINASSLDMARFLQFYINRGSVDKQQIISEPSLARMERAESTNPDKIRQHAGYGLNNYSSSYKNWVYRKHDGAVVGGITEFAYLPSAKIGHAIMTNSDNYGAFKAISNLIRDYETRNLSPPKIVNDVEITDGHRSIEGLYYQITSRPQKLYFINRIINVHALWFNENSLIKKPLLGGKEKVYFPVSPTLYKSNKTGLVSLSLTTDPLVGKVVHASKKVLKPASAMVIYGQLTVAALWLLSIVSSLLYFLVWGIRRLYKKVPPGASIRVRLWPLLSAISVVLCVALYFWGEKTIFESLGAPSFISVGILATTISFAAFSIFGFYTVIKERTAEMNRFNYWYCVFCSSIHVLVTVYLFWFGVIGIQTWS